MTFITGLIIGLIIGWIIEWLIDWFYWRLKGQEHRKQLAKCKEKTERLGTTLADAQLLHAHAEQKVNKLKIDLAEAEQASQQLDAQIRGNQRLHQKVVDAEHEISQLKNQLIDYDHNRNALDASLSQITDLRTRLAGTTQKLHQKPDSLIEIRGIGSSFAKRLNDAGIHTYAQLADLTPNYVREVVAAQKWHKIEPEAWIAEAKRRRNETYQAQKGNNS